MSCSQHSSFSSVSDTDCSLSSIILEKFKDVNLDVGQSANCRIDYKNTLVLLCAKCNIILGDSLGVCGEYADLNSVICLKVTEDVMVKGDQKPSLEGPLATCIYSSLQCSGCFSVVGGVLQATPPHLSAVRDYFLLQKDRINCYHIMNSTMVDGSTLNFEQKSIGEEISKLKQELESEMKRLELLKDLLCRGH
ncbi:hypothetical protein AALO_G00249830 [Alosa alosa]|uniref:Mis18 domain-containing protein n=1 Tax=Alosa alosa TaxID=278164 RepID=A0AAV6FTC7_9TELE|nr:protein Mis18-beta [Alosa alosa]KAG5266103.1 hypothetical protein AALO_G00249830 [Alosa alosa]